MEARRTKLLFIANSLEFGGAEKHVITLINRLSTARFRMSLSYLKSKDALLPQIDQARVDGRVHCCNVSKKVDWHAVGQLAAQIRDEDIDIVVCTNTYSLLYGWLARLSSGRRPRLLDVFHTTSPNSFRETLQILFYRPLFSACDMLVYVCASQRKYWQARALRRGRDTVIHNGVDVHRFSDRYTAQQKSALRKDLGLGEDDYVVGLCAAMRPEKAHADLLEAAARLRDQGIPVKCLLIGDGPRRAEVERQVQALGLERQVHITGFVDDVRPYVACCDVMAIVSHHVETFSIAALEAMALGKPMVMSLIGGAAEQIGDGDNGYLFPPGDIDALAGALHRLHDRTRCRQMGDRARAIVSERFSIEKMVDAYTRLFTDTTAPPAVRTEGMENGRAA